MKIAIYSRKSKFTGKGESIENQIELCRDYIFKNIANAHEEDIFIYEDEGFSGKNMQRPKFQSMMKSAKAEKFDYIICYRLDRISRNVGDFANLIEELGHQETDFICIREQFDTSTPMGRAMMYIASVFAQLERETIAERIRDNMYMLSRTGRWLGGTTPLGFKSEKTEKVTLDGKTRTAFQLSPIPCEMQLVAFIFQKFLETASISATARYLVQREIKTRSGKDFTNVALKAILSNPVYCMADSVAYDFFYEKGCSLAFDKAECDSLCAFMPYNRTNHTGKRQVKNDISQWMLALGKHSGAVESTDYIKASQLLSAKKTKSTEATRNPHTSPALLSGILKCASCGHFMRPHMSNRAYEDGQMPFYYICEYKERSACKKCQMKNLDGHAIDKIICEEVLRLNVADSTLAQGLERLSVKAANKKERGTGELGFLAEQLASNRAMVKNLVQVLSKGLGDDYAAQIIREQINELSQRCQSLEQELAKISTSASERAAQGEGIGRLRNFCDVFESASANDKRKFLRQVIDHVEWDGEVAEIFILRQ